MKLFDLRGRHQPLLAALVNHAGGAIELHGLLGGFSAQSRVPDPNRFVFSGFSFCYVIIEQPDWPFQGYFIPNTALTQR